MRVSRLTSPCSHFSIQQQNSVLIQVPAAGAFYEWANLTRKLNEIWPFSEWLRADEMERWRRPQPILTRIPEHCECTVQVMCIQIGCNLHSLIRPDFTSWLHIGSGRVFGVAVVVLVVLSVRCTNFAKPLLCWAGWFGSTKAGANWRKPPARIQFQ